MKTEPTINIQDEVAKIHAQYGMSEMANYSIEKLFKKYVKQSNPKIKQLEWEERKYCYIARTAFGFYRIFDASPLEKKQGCVLYFGETAQKVSVGTYEECIKNAQIDFENRVKKCLITE